MKIGHWRRLFAILAVFALVAAACGDDDDTAEDTTTTTAAAADDGGEETTTTAAAGDDGGTAAGGYCDDAGDGELIWAHEQEPGDMHLDDPNNNLTITAHIREAMWEGAYGISAATEFYPELLASEVDVVVGDDGVVTYNYAIRDDAVWSDGTPVTSTDFENHFNLYMTSDDGTVVYDAAATAPDATYPYLLGGRLGYELITSFNVVDDKNFNYTMNAFFAGFPSLWSQLMPAHAVGSDPPPPTTLLRRGRPPTGPRCRRAGR